MIKFHYITKTNNEETSVTFLNYKYSFIIPTKECNETVIYKHLIDYLQQFIGTKEYNSPIFVEMWDTIPNYAKTITLSLVHYLKIIIFNEYVMNNTSLVEYNKFFKNETSINIFKLFDMSHNSSINSMIEILENGYNKKVTLDIV